MDIVTSLAAPGAFFPIFFLGSPPRDESPIKLDSAKKQMQYPLSCVSSTGGLGLFIRTQTSSLREKPVWGRKRVNMSGHVSNDLSSYIFGQYWYVVPESLHNTP